MKRTQRLGPVVSANDAIGRPSRGIGACSPARLIAAAVVAAGLLAAGSQAQAVALGRMVVLSRLGEPLRAEIDLTDITPADASSLTVQAASPERLRAAGLNYNAALSNLTIVQGRASNGRAILKVSGSRPINEPYLEMLLDATWASGRVSRSYTVLVDPSGNAPPGADAAQAQALVAPRIAAPDAKPAPVPVPAAAVTPAPPSQRRLPVPAQLPRDNAVVEKSPVKAAAPLRPPVGSQGNGPGAQLVVRSGDTAGRIAATRKPINVSLDQMLVAMLQANPDAFVEGNVNRMRAGAVLDIPNASQAASVPREEAHRMVIAQSRDFNDFRRKIASRTPTFATAASGRASSGMVRAEVDDKLPAANTPDRLTLSKGAVAMRQAQQVAEASQARANAARSAELARNVADLKRLGADAANTTPATQAAVAPVEEIAPIAVADVAPTASAVPVDAATSLAATQAQVTEPAPDTVNAAAAKPIEVGGIVVPVAPVAPVVAEPKAATSLFHDMRLVGAMGMLILLVGGWVAYRKVRRNREAGGTQQFLDGHQPPDSFFGASGGQHVDTAATSPSSVLATTYSPSQLDAGGDVDPLAEAEVYLAYGRDVQAEEILRESLKQQPGRIAVLAKLAEIYSKRMDVAAFDLIATDAHRLSKGEGDDWETIRLLGYQLASDNPLYKPTPAPIASTPIFADTSTLAGAGAASAAYAAAAVVMPGATEAAAGAPVGSPSGRGLDINLDEELRTAMVANELEEKRQPPPDRTFLANDDDDTAEVDTLTMDFSAFKPSAPPPDSVLPPTDDVAPDHGLAFMLETPETMASATAVPKAPSSMVEPEFEAMPEFDMSHLSLDFDTNASGQNSQMSPVTPFASTAPDVIASAALDPVKFDFGGQPDLSRGAMKEVSSEDSLATKLALAAEFGAIGDSDGARHLIEEVIAESSGDVRQRAEHMLRDLD